MAESPQMRSRTLLCIAMIVVAAYLLTACAASHNIQNVATAVPVECRETEPSRPAMPTETMACTAATCLDEFVKAATAEIERREGYEIKLVTALRACIAPITP